LHTDLLQHLTNDNLDVLIVDLNTLETVNSLHLAEHVVLYGTNAFDTKDIVRIYRTFCQLVSGFQIISVLNLDTGTVWDQISLRFSALIVCHNDLTFLLCIFQCGNTFDLCDDGKTLRLPCLEKLLHTGKTLCDIAAGHTAGMEGTHGKLCTWLTDGLSRNNTDRFTYLYWLTSCHVGAVTFCADTDLALTGKDCTDLHCIVWLAVFSYTVLHHTCSTYRSDHMVCLNDNTSIFLFNSLAGETSCNTLLKAFDLFLAVSKSFYPHTWDFAFIFAAVYFPDDHFLGNV